MRWQLPHPNRSRDISPMRVNVPAMFMVGIGVWVAGAVVVGVWLAFGSGAKASWLAICAAGVAIGLLGWGWAKFRHW